MIGLRAGGEPADPYAAQRIARLRRKVAWQASAAYGQPVEDAPVPPVDEAPAPTLVELERAVDVAAAMDPEHAEEWRRYLFDVRRFATVDGRLDDGFRSLVETAAERSR